MKKARKMPALIPFLALVVLVFIGILVYVYVATKRANPQMIRGGLVGQPILLPSPWAGESPAPPGHMASRA